MTSNRHAQFVMVTSKFCNLRCKYCYEFPDLGDPTALTLAQVDRAFQNIRDHYAGDDDPVSLSFVWHGGEPLLIAPDFYWKAFDLQKRIFADERFKVRNTVQTNLTKLDDSRLHLLKHGFDGVGISLDLAGGLRVNRAGKDIEAKVVANIDRLRAAQIRFGGITVLTKANIEYLTEIYAFYRAMNAPFRLLPLHKGPFEAGQGFEIEAKDVLKAYCRLADLWLADEQYVGVSPVVEHINSYVSTQLTGQTNLVYDKREWESIFLVDRDGSLYGYSEAFDADFCYGNLIDSPLGELMASEGYERSAAAAEARFDAACPSCPYLGRGCSGYPMAEGGQDYNDLNDDGSIACTATRGLMAHIETRLEQAGLFRATTKLQGADRPAAVAM